MNKNFVPIVIVGVIVLIGIFAVFALSNQKESTGLSLDLNHNPSPTSAIISTPYPTENMENFTTTNSGLKIYDEKEGTGEEAKSGDTVTVNYLGTLQDGTKFDSSYDRNQPFTTQIGVGQVIAGWDEGIVGMKVGGKRKLIIPSDLGYGSQAVGNIPPNSTLVFEVELLSVR